MINFWQRKPKFNNNAAAVDRISGPSITYGELHTLAETINIMLPKEKQLVALLWTNSIHCLAGYLSALKGGHSVVVLDGAAPATTLYPILQTYMPNYVWKPKNWGNPNAALGKEYSLMPFNEDVIELNPDLALLMPLPEAGTGGLMRFSYEGLQHQAESLAEFIDVKEVDKVLQLMPYLSITGLGLLNACIHRGSCIAFVGEEYTSNESKSFCEDYNPSILFAHGSNLETDLESALKDLSQVVFINTLDSKPRLPDWVKGKIDNNVTVQAIFQIPSIGVVSGLVMGSDTASSLTIGSALPLTRLDVLDNITGTKIKQANTYGNLLLRSNGLPLGPATEISDLNQPDVFEGKLNLNCSGYFTESGQYYLTP